MGRCSLACFIYGLMVGNLTIFKNSGIFMIAKKSLSLSVNISIYKKVLDW